MCWNSSSVTSRRPSPTATPGPVWMSRRRRWPFSPCSTPSVCGETSALASSGSPRRSRIWSTARSSRRSQRAERAVRASLGGAAMSESAPVRSQLDPLRQVLVGVERWSGGTRASTRDELAVEEPLEVRVRTLGDAGQLAAETIAVIMRTPGQDEELAVGFLYGEGLLSGRTELAGIEPGSDADGLPSENVLDVLPASGVD